MAKRKKPNDLTLEQAKELFRYENGKLYWKTLPKYSKGNIGDIVKNIRVNRFRPAVRLRGRIYLMHRIVYLLNHGVCPKRLEFINKTLTADGEYDISIENLFVLPKKVAVKKRKRKFRKELSYFEANNYLEYKNGRLYWKAKPYPTSCVVIGNLAGGASTNHILKVKLHGINYPQHRIVYLLHHGYCPEVVTFIDKTLTHEGYYDISIGNLKAITWSHEKSVTISRRNNKTSKYRGVFLDKESKKYRVLFRVNRAMKNGGMFNNEIDAARKYDEMARQLIGDDAVLNFPEENPAIS